MARLKQEPPKDNSLLVSGEPFVFSMTDDDHKYAARNHGGYDLTALSAGGYLTWPLLAAILLRQPYRGMTDEDARMVVDRELAKRTA